MPMGKITTHVLDTASGNPAAGVRIRLMQQGKVLADTLTNADGRCDSPLLTDASPGTYQLIFSIGDYFRARGTPSSFLDEIPIHFIIEPGRNYHVPLACSPYAYSTYRGS
jgi:5-hydroxyisourate hydrolase